MHHSIRRIVFHSDRPSITAARRMQILVTQSGRLTQFHCLMLLLGEYDGFVSVKR